MFKMKPITKLLLLCITLLTLFMSTIVVINKTIVKNKICNDKVAIYNDSILTIRAEFNKYLIYDSNININLLDKSNYINKSNIKLDLLNNYVNNSEIDSLAKKKEFYIKSLIIKNYKVKESYGVVKYKVVKGWIFKKTTIKEITYKKIDKKEIDKLNKIELFNKNAISKYHTNNDKINLRLDDIVINKINYFQLKKSNIIKANTLEIKNNFIILISINIIISILIILLSLNIIRDIKHILIKYNLDKVTLSFLINYIKENKN